MPSAPYTSPMQPPSGGGETVLPPIQFPKTLVTSPSPHYHQRHHHHQHLCPHNHCRAFSSWKCICWGGVNWTQSLTNSIAGLLIVFWLVPIKNIETTKRPNLPIMRLLPFLTIHLLIAPPISLILIFTPISSILIEGRVS